jgi:multidrug efflux pump subunit AcrB
MIGLSNEDLAAMVQAGLSGYAPTMLAEGDQKIPIRLRLRPEERAGPDALGSLALVSTSAGLRVPLSQVVEVRPEMVAPKIRRRNHERCLTVKSDAVPGVLPSAIVGAADRALRRESASWPPGYRYEFGGEREEQAKGFRSVAIALAVSLASIYLALVLQFNSVTKPLVVFAAVPFGIVAGMLGLLIFDAPFGFMAFLGVASLAGVIVSHIIVLFDYIEEMHHRGEDLHRAVIDAALVRLRPVLVTVLATVGGLVPLAIEGGPLWEPMCYVQIVGLLAATLVTKIVVPVLYVIFVEDLRWIEWTRPADAAPLAPPADGAMLEAASK